MEDWRRGVKKGKVRDGVSQAGVVKELGSETGGMVAKERQRGKYITWNLTRYIYCLLNDQLLI